MSRVFGIRTCFEQAAIAWAVTGAIGAQVSAQNDAGPPATLPAHAASAPPATQPAKVESYLRVVEDKGKSIALEIATRTFKPVDGEGPDVALVGVAHIGEAAFYRDLQVLLDEHDIVLYESVKPPGTGKPGGETDEERIDSTSAAIGFVGGMIEAHRIEQQELPETLAEARAFAAEQDPRLAQWFDVAAVDAWGRALAYAIDDSERGFTLQSLGADGAAGGEGANADIGLDEEELVDPLELSSEDGLQTQLAEALGLEFQLVALRYDLPTWRCSDMAIDEVSRSLQAKGLDFGPLGGTLAGSSLPAKLISVLLNLMRMADAFLEGAIADTFKVVMIELLADEQMMEVGLQQLGEGFAEVIINERNQVVLDDLAAITEHEPDAKSIAVLYGAGHMIDLERRLVDQLGYEPVADKWLTAIEVDFSKSAVSPREIMRIRLMIRQMVRQQMRLQGKE